MNLVVIDGQGNVAYIKASGIGTELDPYVLERFGTVDVTSSVLPTDASTESKQDAQITELLKLVATVDIDTLRTSIIDMLPAGTNT